MFLSIRNSFTLLRQSKQCLGWLQSYATEAAPKQPSPRVEQIRQIRDATNAPLLDCKKALDEAGNVEGALALLRAKGMKTVAREGRIAADGLLALSVKGSAGAIIELNSETDFVSRLPEFGALAQSIAESALAAQPAPSDALVDALLATKAQQGSSAECFKDAIAQFMYKTGEKIELKRALRLQEFPDQAQDASVVVVGGYVHPGAKHASLVALRAKGGELPSKVGALEELSRNLAIQVTGFKPKFVARADAPEWFTPEEDTNPFLLDQSFYMADPSGNTTVQTCLQRKGQEINAALSIECFHQWSLGQTHSK